MLKEIETITTINSYIIKKYIQFMFINLSKQYIDKQYYI